MVLPKLRDVLPKSREVLPKLGEVLPKSRTILPKSREVLPKLLDVVPKSREVLPKLLDVPPKSREVLPKLLDVPPPLGRLLQAQVARLEWLSFLVAGALHIGDALRSQIPGAALLRFTSQHFLTAPRPVPLPGWRRGEGTDLRDLPSGVRSPQLVFRATRAARRGLGWVGVRGIRNTLKAPRPGLYKSACSTEYHWVPSTTYPARFGCH
jgi:hypothetical protein